MNVVQRLSLFFLTMGLLSSPWAQAIDQFEIQVYDAEINKAGEVTLENHVNEVVSGLSESQYPGQLPFQHLLHITQELALGMNEFWELGFYYQSAISFPPDYHYSGVKLRSKLVLPKRISGAYEFGANFEISKIPHALEESQYSIELRPIMGLDLKPFALLMNPILGWNLSGGSGVPELSPAFKFSWDTGKHFALGLEYYSGLGALDSFSAFPRQEHYAYLAVDLLDQEFELNLGAGAGLTDASNGFVVKSIVGVKLY